MTPLQALFDSRDERYRSPFGAQPAGRAVFFRILLPREWGCTGARLCVRQAAVDVEKEGELPPARSAMFWAGMEGEDREWWDVHYTPAVPALYWYWFELDTAQGPRTLARLPDGTASEAEGAGASCWQLTAYDRRLLRRTGWPAGYFIRCSPTALPVPARQRRTCRPAACCGRIGADSRTGVRTNRAWCGTTTISAAISGDWKAGWTD